MDSFSQGGIFINNAGIVLANNFIPMLFERIGILEDNQIKSQEQGNAVQYLQYLITGLTETEEHFLPLNKVLCGLEISSPIPNTIEISQKDKELIEGLLNAIIGYWTSIGHSSIDGFRGNWLIRNGILSELEDRFELTVEKNAYDILLNQFPFSFSIIRFPWMKKPLYVTWPF